MKQRNIFLLTIFILIGAALNPARAALLGVSPGLPNTTYRGDTGYSYTASTQLLNINTDTVPLYTLLPTGAVVEVLPPRAFDVLIQVGNDGTLVGGVPGDDLILEGEIDVDEDGTVDYSGTLLTGEVLAFGYVDINGTDRMDFRFRVTGGSFSAYYAGKDIGVTLTIEQSTFVDDFTVNSTGLAKGNIGPIEPLAGCTGRIGDYVWHDLDHDGIQDAGEPGIVGVQVQLLDDSANILESVQTGADGSYRFEELCAGDYQVTLVDPIDLMPTLPDAGGDDSIDNDYDGTPVPVTLNDDADEDLTVDFGFESACSGQIGDYVWHDLNHDGTQDDGSVSGLGGVTVTLTDVFGDLTTAVTDAGGYYGFGGLCAGDYTVDVDETTVPLPAGFTSAAVDAAGDDELDNDADMNDGNGGEVAVFLAADDIEDLSIDFGFETRCTGVIGNYVWLDTNRDGIQSTGETGLSGVQLQLVDGSGASLATDTTDVSGYYSFTGLCAGDYGIKVIAGLPADHFVTGAEQGGDDQRDSDLDPTTPTAAVPVTLAVDGAEDLSIDFGYQSPCTSTIGDYVWNDLDADGIQDAGEPGIGGVNVTLSDAANVPLQSTVTSTNGAYGFSGLCGGEYHVDVNETSTALGGFSPTAPNSTADAADSDSVNGDPVIVNLPEDSDDVSVDFGFFRDAGIGNEVFEDLNRNGVRDAGEPGVAGAVIGISGPDGYGASATTGADGAYRFDHLVPGTYSLSCTAPAGYSLTLPYDQGSSVDKDSNANPADGSMGSHTLASGEANLTIDCGLYRPNPAIDIRKQVEGADSRNVAWGADVSFEIVVSNTGNVDLSNVVVSDPLVADCDRSIGVLTAGTQFSYTCTATAVTADFTNVAAVTGDYNGQSVVDTDPSSVHVIVPDAWIGDRVWLDLNRNGVQEAGEPGMAGVLVTLTDATGGPLDSMASNADGSYGFTVAPGAYRVCFEIPNAAYMFSLRDQGGDDATDSDADTLTGCTPVTTLSPGESDPSWDAGIFEIVGECGACDGKVDALTLQYNGSVSAWIEVVQQKGEVAFAGQVDAGALFSFEGLDKKGTLGPWVTVYVDGVEATTIHTSCSVDIGPGSVFGDFLVVDGSSRNGGRLCAVEATPPNQPCGVCDGKVTDLTLRYDGASAAWIEVTQKDGEVVYLGNVEPGGVFSFRGTDKKGTLGTEIFIYVNGTPVQQIHTSCSVTIGAGSVFGDFAVVTGHSRNGGLMCPVM